MLLKSLDFAVFRFPSAWLVFLRFHWCILRFIWPGRRRPHSKKNGRKPARGCFNQVTFSLINIVAVLHSLKNTYAFGLFIGHAAELLTELWTNGSANYIPIFCISNTLELEAGGTGCREIRTSRRIYNSDAFGLSCLVVLITIYPGIVPAAVGILNCFAHGNPRWWHDDQSNAFSDAAWWRLSDAPPMNRSINYHPCD